MHDMAMTRAKLCASAGLAGLLLGHGGPALAQAAATTTGGDSQTAEIIVTAQKRAENVQQVPISVTVISADQLTRRGVQGIQDLSQASASLEFTAPSAAPGGGGFVRGIGTNLIGGATATSSVSVVLDGVVLGNTNVSDLFDTDRVEVLKGPQGTLFGSSVSAGVLNVTTKAPKIGETSGYLNGEMALTGMGSDYTRKVLRGAINLPVSDNSALRIAVQTYANDGMTRDAYTGQNETFDAYAVRVRYLAQFGDNVTFNLIGDYDRMLDDNNSLLTYRAATGPVAQALAACGVTVGPENTDSCQGLATYTHTDVGGISAQFDVRLGDGVTLTSITSWRERLQHLANDLIGIAPDIARQYLAVPNCTFTNCLPVVELVTGSAANPEIDRHNLFTQELRLASDANHHLEWVAGLYFQRATFAEFQPGDLKVNFGAPTDTVLFGWNNPGQWSSHAADYAAFGNVTYYLGDATRLIGGLRYTHSTVWETESDYPNDSTSAFYTGSAKADALTWRAGVQHDFGRDTMVYLTASTGYKAPEINDALNSTTIAPATYSAMQAIKAERPTSFELGIKQTLFGHRLYVNADVFYTDVHDFQTQSCVSVPSGLSCADINVPSVHTKGLEWDLFGHPFRGNTVNVSGIYNVAKYPAGFLGADGTDMGGYQLNYAPKFKMTVSLEQDVPLSARYALVVGGDATIRSSQSMYLSADPQFVVPGNTIFNARVSLKSTANWSVAVFGRNLGDKLYPTQLYPTTAFAQGGLWQVLDGNSRRTVGVQFDARF
jgi:iron complex outermembrane recepter protein